MSEIGPKSTWVWTPNLGDFGEFSVHFERSVQKVVRFDRIWRFWNEEKKRNVPGVMPQNGLFPKQVFVKSERG